MESHGKAVYFLKTKMQKDKKLKKITDKSETGFNFNRNRHKHAFYVILLCWKICERSDCFDTTLGATA